MTHVQLNSCSLRVFNVLRRSDCLPAGLGWGRRRLQRRLRSGRLPGQPRTMRRLMRWVVASPWHSHVPGLL